MASVKMRRKRKKHDVKRDTIGGSVVLKCQCGWRGYTWDRHGAGNIPSEWTQWKDYYVHLN